MSHKLLSPSYAALPQLRGVYRIRAYFLTGYHGIGRYCVMAEVCWLLPGWLSMVLKFSIFTGPWSQSRELRLVIANEYQFKFNKRRWVSMLYPHSWKSCHHTQGVNNSHIWRLNTLVLICINKQATN